MTEEQEKRLAEYNERLAKAWSVFEKYPTESVAKGISRIEEQMHEDELLADIWEEI